MSSKNRRNMKKKGMPLVALIIILVILVIAIIAFIVLDFVSNRVNYASRSWMYPTFQTTQLMGAGQSAADICNQVNNRNPSYRFDYMWNSRCFQSASDPSGCDYEGAQQSITIESLKDQLYDNGSSDAVPLPDATIDAAFVCSYSVPAPDLPWLDESILGKIGRTGSFRWANRGTIPTAFQRAIVQAPGSLSKIREEIRAGILGSNRQYVDAGSSSVCDNTKFDFTFDGTSNPTLAQVGYTCPRSALGTDGKNNSQAVFVPSNLYECKDNDCKTSGFKRGPNCPNTDCGENNILVPAPSNPQPTSAGFFIQIDDNNQPLSYKVLKAVPYFMQTNSDGDTTPEQQQFENDLNRWASSRDGFLFLRINATQANQ